MGTKEVPFDNERKDSGARRAIKFFLTFSLIVVIKQELKL